LYADHEALPGYRGGPAPSGQCQKITAAHCHSSRVGFLNLRRIYANLYRE
jgi:hypothetical protein